MCDWCVCCDNQYELLFRGCRQHNAPSYSFVVCITHGIPEFSSLVEWCLILFVLYCRIWCISMTYASWPFGSFRSLFEPLLSRNGYCRRFSFDIDITAAVVVVVIVVINCIHIRCIIWRITLIPMNNKPRVNLSLRMASNRIESIDAYDRIN